MSARWPHGQLRDEALPASPEFSRLLLLGFLVAGLLGFAAGVAWIGWHLLSSLVAR